MKFRHNEKTDWNEVLFSTTSEKYALIFYPGVVILYKCKRYENFEHRERFLDKIPEILDHLKQLLTEEEFKEMEKFFFENI